MGQEPSRCLPYFPSLIGALPKPPAGNPPNSTKGRSSQLRHPQQCHDEGTTLPQENVRTETPLVTSPLPAWSVTF